MRPDQQAEYIVQCVREGGSMYEDDARAFLAEHDAHVRDERDAEIVRWLGKKAREYRAKGGGLVTEAAAEVIGLMAAKISRGAVRPNNTLLPAGVAPTFFEPDRTYTRPHYGETITFVVAAVSTSPDGRTTVAHGWRKTPYTGGGWEPTTSDDFTGWTDATEGATA